MECKEIVTGVRHDVRGRNRVDSFFLIEAANTDSDLLGLIGESYVDRFSMSEFEHWLLGDLPHCTLMVSLDLKYVVIRRSGGPFDVYLMEGEQLLPCPSPLPVYVTKDLLADLVRTEIEPFPEMCQKYGHRVRRRVIPLRIQPSPLVSNIFSYEPMIRQAIQDPVGADTDCLILAFLVSDASALQISEDQVGAIRDELSDRLTSRSQRRLTFANSSYRLQGLTFREIEARKQRAARNFEAMCGFSPNIENSGQKDLLVAWLKKLSLDELIELTAHGWFQAEFPSSREKVLVSTCQQVVEERANVQVRPFRDEVYNLFHY